MKNIIFLLVFAALLSACAPVQRKAVEVQKPAPTTARQPAPTPTSQRESENWAALHEDGWTDEVFNKGNYESFLKKLQGGGGAPVDFKQVRGFYLKTDIALPKDINFYTINSDIRFQEVLGRSKMAMDKYTYNTRDTFLAVIAVAPSTVSYTFKALGVFSEGSQVYIAYSLLPAGDVRYLKSDVWVFEIKRPRIVTTVHFINEGTQKGFAIPYGKRTDKSPKSIQDIRRNYMGTYKGVLSSLVPGSSRLITELRLMNNFTFVLKQSYPDNLDRVFESTGKWAPNEDLSSFIINYDKGEREQMKFFFLDRTAIEQLNANGDKIEGIENILKK